MQFPESLGGRLVKIAALGLVVLIEIGAMFFVVLPSLAGPPQNNPFPTLTLSSTKTTTKTSVSSTTGPKASISVSDAVIVNNTLMMLVKNTGSVYTQGINFMGMCTPGFDVCFAPTYKGTAPADRIFVLAPGAQFRENLTGICVVPEVACDTYYPVTNFTYYLMVKFTFTAGPVYSAFVTAKANNTYPVRSAVQGVVYSFNTYSRNGSGSLNAYIATNSSETKATFATYLYRQNGKGAFNFKLLYNLTGCGGRYYNPDTGEGLDCSSGNITVAMNFWTVTSGIGTKVYPPPYLLVIRDLTMRATTNFAMWVQLKSNP